MPQTAQRDPNLDEGQAYGSGPTQQSKGGSIARDIGQAGKEVASSANRSSKPDGSDLRVSPTSRGGGDQDSIASRGARAAEALRGGGDVDKTTGQAGRATQAALEASGTNKKKEDQGGVERATRRVAGKAARAGVDAVSANDQLGQAADQAFQTIDPKKASEKGLKGAVATIGIGVTLLVAPFVILLLIIFYVVTHPWDAVKEVITNTSFLRFALSARELAVGPGSSQQSIAAITGAMPYEVEYKPNSVVAAPNQARPEPGTLEETISKIDYETSRNKFKGSYCEYEVITKLVVASDGSRRSVIDKVVDSGGKTVQLSSPAVYQCVLEQYPVMETMMRSEQARKINRQKKINLSYAEPKDSKNLEGKSKEDIEKFLHKKSTDRLWRNEGYPAECVQDFKPSGKKVDKAIAEVINDLLCGKKPEQITVNYPITDYGERAAETKEEKKKQAASRAEVICAFYDKLNKDAAASLRYRKDRSVSSSRAGIQALTLADTGVAGEIPIDELNNDFYKISNFASSRAYNYEVNGSNNGEQMDPEAIPTTSLGITSDLDAALAAEGLLTFSGECEKLNSQSGDGNFFNIFSSIFDVGEDDSTQTVQNITNLTTILRGRLKDANPTVYKNINDVTLNDILVRTIRITSNISNSGVEEGPDNFNRMVLGSKVTTYDYTFALLGGTYQTEAEAAQASAQVESYKRLKDKQNGIAYRLFNKKNHRSLVSRIAAESTATPPQLAEKTSRYALNMLNPIRAFAELNTMIAYVGYGETNRAIAAVDDDRAYWKIDTAGVQTTEDAIQNARYIEALKKKIADPAYANDETIQAIAASFSAWDKCMETYYPDMQTLDESQDRSCQIMRNSGKGRTLASTYSVSSSKYGLPSGGARYAATLSPTTEKALARKYATYKGHMNFYGAWARLSKTEKDEEMYANTSSGSESTGSNVPQTDPGADTSATPCPQVPGISPVAADPERDVAEGGIAQTFGPGKVPKNKIRLCAVQGIVVNVSIATSLNDMINAARSNKDDRGEPAPITLTGGGWRSFKEQEGLRATNGCPADVNASPSSCRVPTARPGTSNHEQGEAIDFKNSSSRGTPVFYWLSKNAARFGLKNLPSEPWHWSRTGG